MEAILLKVFATALALSLVTTRPDAIKTEFDPAADQAEVMRILGDGCAQIRKSFDIENIDLDDLIDTVMTDTRGTDGEVKAFRGLKFSDLHLAYRQVCKRETLETPAVDPAQLIEYFNLTLADLPDHTRLKGLQLPGLSTVIDGKGKSYAELFEAENRRIWVRLADIPKHVRDAFVAAEDKRFFEHKGVDERSVIRAFLVMFAEPNRRQGGSTITQQVAKNLLVGDDISYERKIREIIAAARLDQTMSKDEILEIYLNAIFLGRGAWGIEMAARSYFNKSAKDLSPVEGAMLAGLTKGPNFYNPDRHPQRARERLAYVLDRMREDGALTPEQLKAAQSNPVQFASYDRPRRTSGFHFVDHLRREARNVANIPSLTQSSYVVRSTVVPELQRATELALQDGLARYEQTAGRAVFEGPEGNIGAAIKRLSGQPTAEGEQPAWQRALLAARLPLYDVQWEPAVVVDKARLKSGHESIRVGLRDGRVLPLSTFGSRTRQLIGVHDVVYVSVTTPSNPKQGIRVDLRSRPRVQGAAVVLENSTGRILAMVGGFSYPLSQLNRTTQSRRQPGSALKPLTYLTALGTGLQPNTLIDDQPITLPPIGARQQVFSYSHDSYKDWWSPKNYDGGFSGAMTLRRALEQSKNLPTAHLLQGGISGSPEGSLDRICALGREVQIYSQCERYYPFILGAQPVRVIDMAAFYATIANEGRRPTPYGIESIEKDGATVYRAQPRLIGIASADRAATYQLKSILQGVVARGTAASRANLAPFIGGKTGTTDNENDAWFVGFSNDVTIAVWVGYDNARGRRTLGSGQTGGKIALPIFERIVQAAWTTHAPRAPLRGPSPEAQRQLIALPIDVRSGERLQGSSRAGSNAIAGAFTEHFRLDSSGRLVETRNRLVANDYLYSHQLGDNTGAPWDNSGSYYYRGDRDEPPTYRERSGPPTPFFFLDQLFRPQSRYQEPPPPPPGQRYAPDRRQAQPQQRPPQPRRMAPDDYWGPPNRRY
jgi:penicillin-binding protein 1A